MAAVGVITTGGVPAFWGFRGGKLSAVHKHGLIQRLTRSLRSSGVHYFKSLASSSCQSIWLPSAVSKRKYLQVLILTVL